MHNPDVSILITAPIDEPLLQTLTRAGFNAEVIPFIQTEIIRTKSLQEDIKAILKQEAVVVFTSANAVEAVKENAQTPAPAWKIYCIGNATAKAVEKYFGKALIAATADDAASLAEKIIEHKKLIGEVYFFCGDKRRNELPAILQQQNIAVNEVIVYITSILPRKTDKNYNGILFFSPSAVEGFFSNNILHKKTVVFAIGKTTAEAIKRFTDNTLIVSKKPGKQELVEKAIAYFTV